MSETLFMTHRWMAPSLSHTHTHSHNLSSHSFSSHTSLYHIPANNPISNRGHPTPTKNHETKKPPAQLTNTINTSIITYLSPPSQPYPESNPRGEGGTPYLHSTQTIKSSFILHLPTPPERNTIILHQTSNAIFPHLDTCILGQQIHTRTLSRRYPWFGG